MKNLIVFLLSILSLSSNAQNVINSVVNYGYVLHFQDTVLVSSTYVNQTFLPGDSLLLTSDVTINYPTHIIKIRVNPKSVSTTTLPPIPQISNKTKFSYVGDQIESSGRLRNVSIAVLAGGFIVGGIYMTDPKTTNVGLGVIGFTGLISIGLNISSNSKLVNAGSVLKSMD
jgi:hypothetical protein